MENNEENLGSQEPTTGSVSTKPTNTKLIAIVAIAVVAILLVFFMFFTRSAKSTVKDFVKSIEKCNASKSMKLMDFEGVAAFTMSGSNLSKFDENYDTIMDKMKDMDKDAKKAYNEQKDELVDDLQKGLDEIKSKKVKYSVKNIKTEKVDDCKKLTKVTCDITVKLDGKENTMEDVEFYTMKKGMKHYLVSTGFGGI